MGVRVGGRLREHGELDLSSQRLRTLPSWKQTAPRPQLPQEALLSCLKEMIRPSVYPFTGSSGVSRLLGEGQARPGLKKLALLACQEACCISGILCAMGGSVHNLVGGSRWQAGQRWCPLPTSEPALLSPSLKHHSDRAALRLSKPRWLLAVFWS